MLKEKVRNGLRNKLGTTKEVKHIVSGPRDLVKKLPSLIGKTPDNNTLVMIETDGDYIESIKFADVSKGTTDELFKTIKDMHNTNNSVVFCIYATKPTLHKELADVLMSDFCSDDSFVRDILYINKNRWGSYLCIDKSCCPKGGNKID